MPVTNASAEVSGRPLLQELTRGGGPAPQAFLRYLQATAGGSARTRYRFVDFLDEACPISSDGEVTTDVGTASGEDEAMEEPQTQQDVFQISLPGPSTCSYLGVGQSFIGTQRLSVVPPRGTDDWQVVVRIQGLDMARGYVCGVMEAKNVPQANSPIITFWEGEIVDNNNHTFFTQKWGASRDTDLKHWGKFSAFAQLDQEVQRHAGRSPQLSTSPCLFMRWKETFFVNTSESCGLTIAGFYYICLDRQSGGVSGYYFDPNSAPFQYLSLKSTAAQRGGMSFGSYELR